MTTALENPKKVIKKSQVSIVYKTDASRKSLNHKQKIVNAIKKSTLKNMYDSKHRKSTKSRNSISNTDPKKKIPPYQIQSQRNRTSKTANSISRTVPLSISKQQKLEFPFEAIKFKNNSNEEKINQNKTHDQFYIRYDEPELGQMDMKMLQNSKKITGSHNQRIGRYSQQKMKNKGQYISGVKSIEFRQNVLKLYKFLDPFGNQVISHSQIDYRKLPQAVLYFLGGLFQRIRQKHLYLSQKQFQEQCDQIYLKSSNDDIDWFIQEVNLLARSTEERSKQISEKFSLRNAQTQEESHIHNQMIFRQKLPTQKPNFHQSSINFNNLSFDQQSSVISFRKQNKQIPINFEGRHSKASNHPFDKESQKSAQFGQPNQHHMFSFNTLERISFGFDGDKERQSIKPDSIAEETINLAQLEKLEVKYQPKARVGIKKNQVEKVQDMRQQIYAKLDKLKIAPQIKDTNILRENFKTNSARETSTIVSMRDPPKENISPSGIAKNYRYTDSFNLERKPLQENKAKTSNNISLAQPLIPKKQPNSVLQQKSPQNISFPNEKSTIQISEPKVSGWINKSQKCQKAFDQLQKIRDQFKRHKNTIEYRQAQRQSYFKEEQSRKSQLKNNMSRQELLAQQQTRVLKLNQNLINGQKIKSQENKENPCYQRNIDRLNNLSNSRDRNPLSINLNETLSNSCRKSVEITLPLKGDFAKGMSYSDKKPVVSSKIDKIDELSSKLEQYLMKNAEKIEYSKNFTEKTGTQNSKFNRLLAL